MFAKLLKYLWSFFLSFLPLLRDIFIQNKFVKKKNKSDFLLRSCHRGAVCWRNPQKTPHHPVPRPRRWLGSRGGTRKRAAGQSCPIPILEGCVLFGWKTKRCNTPRGNLWVHLKIFPPYIYSLLHLREWGHSLNSSQSSSQIHRGLSTEAGQRKRRIKLSQSSIKTGSMNMSWTIHQKEFDWILILVMFRCLLISVWVSHLQQGSEGRSNFRLSSKQGCSWFWEM